MAFKKCREFWHFGSKLRLGWEYVPGIEPLDFGIAIHAGLEVYYDPQRWDDDRSIVQQETLLAFMDHMNDWRNRLKRTEQWDSQQTAWKEHRTLGIGMLEHYFLWAPKRDVYWEPIKSEIEFEVPIPVPKELRDQLPSNFASLDGNLHKWDLQTLTWIPVVYQGRIDLIVRSLKTGNYRVVDHKAQPLTSKVLTPFGWVEMGSLIIGSQVIGSNGKPTNVTGLFPQGVTPCYEVEFHDGTKVECSEDHLWLIKGTTGFYAKEYKVRTLRNIRSLSFESWAPPQVAPIEFEAKDFPVHPYLLGLWLAEGSNDKSMVVLSNKLGDTIKLVEPYLAARHSLRKNSELNNSWTLEADIKRKSQYDPETNLVRKGLRDLGLWDTNSFTKFVPEVYLLGSIEQRLLLLQGLMDGDGTVYNGKYSRFCSGGHLLHEGVKALILSLGGVTNPVSWTKNKKGNPQGFQNFKLPAVFNPFQLDYKRSAYKATLKGFRRRIKSIRYIGKKQMQCISVEASDGLYVTDGYILTHNTAAQFGMTGHWALDSQVGSYVWAVRRILNINVVGFVINELRKKVLSEPQILKDGTLSKRKNQTTSVESYRSAIRKLNLHEKDYADILAILVEKPEQEYFRRIMVDRSDEELRVLERIICLEAIDMVNDPAIYPNPSRWNCLNCQFRSPCQVKQEGSDFLWHLEHSVFYEKRAST